MKKMIYKSLLGLAAVFMFAVTANAQTTIVTPVGVTATLADQLSVTKLFDVNFGGIFISKTNDVVVTMDYTGVVTVTTGTTSLFNTTAQQQGQLQIGANKAAQFSVQYPATVNLVNGNNSLVYTPALFDKVGVAIPSSAVTNYSVSTDEVGDGSSFNKLINIAGTLAIPQISVPGIYLGTVDVTITWA